MLSIDYIRDNPRTVRESIEQRGLDVDLDSLLNLDKERRQLINRRDSLRAEQKKVQKKAAEDEKARQEARSLKSRVRSAEYELNQVEEQYNTLLWEVPNIVLDDVPIGEDESGNVVDRQWGDIPQFDFEPRDHVALGELLDIIDTEKAAKIAGTRFAFFKREAVLLEMALIRYTFDVLTSQDTLARIADSLEEEHSEVPFVPVMPPAMVRPEVFRRMARLDSANEADKFYLERDDLYLIGSAEHSLGPMHMDEILEGDGIPRRYIGFSPSFRREAGSYGKDTRGILRVHQFDKLEMQTFTWPDYSIDEQNFLVAIQEYLMQQLNLPYQVVKLCTGDMGKPDARQIDIETWIPSQQLFRETHSADLILDYQARRLGTRIRKRDGEKVYAHMNDATAIAIGRTLVAILENYQQRDGSVKIPEVLQEYAGFDAIYPK